MIMTIDLDEIIDAIQASDRDTTHYLNTRNGDIIIRSESFSDQELNEIDDELDDNWEYILELPTQRDADEFGMMRDYIWELPQSQAKDALKASIKGQGAFKRFRDVCKNYGLLDEWLEYKDDQYVEFAKDWCQANEIGFDEKPRVTYRHATRQDMETLIELKNKELGLDDDSLNFEIERWFAAQFKTNSLYQIIAWWKTEIIATGAINWTFQAPTPECPNGRVGTIVNFWCDPKYADLGYQKEILDRLLKETSRRRIYQVSVTGDNKELYEGAGFKQVDNVYKQTVEQ